MRKRVGVLISGRGSNMRSLIEASRDPAYPAEIVAAFSNKPDAPGLAYAAANNIVTHSLRHSDFPSREAFDEALNTWLESQNLDLVCCAGYMRIMTAAILKPWAGRMLNIHPSLLPAYKGLHTHERALADGAKFHGATVHFVTEELDGGPIVARVSISVLPDDTPESLATRVLSAEHPLYAKALALVASGQIQMTKST
jgi:phosphoribosylglycinamide formyltransferase 1